MSHMCDSVSWAIWAYKTYNIFHEEEKLTVDHRQKMNDLVDLTNEKLREIAENAGDNVFFIDYDLFIGDFGGRYCEHSVDESTDESNSRPGLMFYEMKSKDWLGDTPFKRNTDGSANGTFYGDINVFADITTRLDPNATFKLEDSVETETDTETAAVFQEVQNAEDEDELAIEIPNILPDGIGHVFHPQILLHELIASLVIFTMQNQNLEANGFSKAPEVLTLDSCSLEPQKPTEPVKHPVCFTGGPNGEFVSSDCSGDATIDKDMCEDLMRAGMDTCDPDSDQIHGTSVIGECAQYMILLSELLDDNHPPWRPAPEPEPEPEPKPDPDDRESRQCGLYIPLRDWPPANTFEASVGQDAINKLCGWKDKDDVNLTVHTDWQQHIYIVFKYHDDGEFKRGAWEEGQAISLGFEWLNRCNYRKEGRNVNR
ncbi:hypothetical protein DL769_011705 [Monosporascus sp. CRB-8-3]|nr:hypothetical protein DL769_011705 [Monosporascus sp. CRB-8-3]